MYKIKNVALDPLYKEYNVESLDELTDDQLSDLVRDKAGTDQDLNIQPAYFTRTTEDGKPVRGDFDKYGTINKIIEANSFSEYMGESYWSERHRQIVRNRRILENIKKMDSRRGQVIFDLFAEHKLGFSNLKPEEEVVIDVNKRWVEEYLGRHPMWKKLEVVNLEEDVKVEVQQEKSKPKHQLKTDVTNIVDKMTDKEVRDSMRKRGLKYIGVKKRDLREQLIEALSK